MGNHKLQIWECHVTTVLRSSCSLQFTFERQEGRRVDKVYYGLGENGELAFFAVDADWLIHAFPYE